VVKAEKANEIGRDWRDLSCKMRPFAKVIENVDCEAAQQFDGHKAQVCAEGPKKQ